MNVDVKSFVPVEFSMRAHAMGGLPFVPWNMEVKEHSPWLTSVRKHAERASIKNAHELFLYRHKVSEKWVVAMWLEHPKTVAGFGIIVPIFSMEENPDGPKPDCPPLDLLIENLRPSIRRVKAQLDEYREKERKKMQVEANHEAARDMGKTLSRMGEDRLGDDLIAGRTRYSIEGVE